jgi:hypothetical protein
MKTLFFFILAILYSYSVTISGQQLSLINTPGTPDPEISKISWDKQHIDVGYVMQNKPVIVNYTFRNDSDRPVVIEKITTSCGCTAARHSQEPVLPGESSTIIVTYNAGKPGAFNKSIRVKTSANENDTVLTLSGEVQ